MYLIIDFGLTRLANKVKKKSWEKGRADIKQIRIEGDGLKRIRLERDWLREKLRNSETLGYTKAGREVWRGRNRNSIRGEIGLPKLTRKYKSGEYAPRSKVIKEMIPDTKNFTDIRKTDDKALSKSGYMGFRNTPNSFHEESIPIIESGKKIKVKPRITSLEY